MRPDLAPQGLVGAGERPAILCHLNIGIKGERGAPIYKGRFWFMTQTTRSVSYGNYSSPTRDPHPSFAEWNAGAKALGKDIPPQGPGRYGVVHGNLIGGSLPEVARWSRCCQKPAAGAGPVPPSRRAWCEGNGIIAKRFVGLEGEQEVFRTIPCPNGDCPLAMAKLCKPAGHLLFMVREEGFPSIPCEWTTGGWESLAALRGFFESILGTAAVRTPEELAAADESERATWIPGLAAQFGIANPSIFGLPFMMVVTERTKPAKQGASAGSRYPVVHFGFDGNPAEFFLAQRRQFAELAGGSPAPRLLPSVQDPLFERVVRHESRVEIMPEVVDPPAEARLDAEQVAELRRLAGERAVSWDAVEEHFGGPVADVVGVSADALRRRVQDVIQALRG